MYFERVLHENGTRIQSSSNRTARSRLADVTAIGGGRRRNREAVPHARDKIHVNTILPG